MEHTYHLGIAAVLKEGKHNPHTFRKAVQNLRRGVRDVNPFKVAKAPEDLAGFIPSDRGSIGPRKVKSACTTISREQ